MHARKNVFTKFTKKKNLFNLSKKVSVCRNMSIFP